MDLKQLERITNDVAENLNISTAQRTQAARYVKRAVNACLIFCNRDDLPAPLEDTAAQMAEDMLRADGIIQDSNTPVASITRGDTSISYKNTSSAYQNARDFVKNYTGQLIHFKRPKIPGCYP